MGIQYTKIESNIVNYLFVDFQCPYCQEPVAISLGSLYKKDICRCSGCGRTATLFLKGGNLERFAESFDSLYEQLRKIGLSLMFFHESYATIWSQGDKPKDGKK